MTRDAAVGPEDVLDFWFEGVAGDAHAIAARSKVWFQSGPAFDQLCRERFGKLHEQAARGELDGWQETPRGALALVIVLDQFSRNIHRGTGAAFACDDKALACCLRARERGFDDALLGVERMFFYMPFQHTEDRERQDESVTVWKALAASVDGELAEFFDGSVGHAREHREVVHRFGRFPHRNAALGRVSTLEEHQYLDGGAPRYGQ
jgi:uncharacterized protein (DUF924 family)